MASGKRGYGGDSGDGGSVCCVPKCCGLLEELVSLGMCSYGYTADLVFVQECCN